MEFDGQIHAIGKMICVVKNKTIKHMNTQRSVRYGYSTVAHEPIRTIVRVDETYIKVKEQWMYLYRAVDSRGNTIGFSLSKTRNHKAAERFFKKALRSFHASKPHIITVDKNPAHPIAIEKRKKDAHRHPNPIA